MAGSIVPFVTIDAQSSVQDGLTADFGSAKPNITMQVRLDGVITAGVVALQVSMNGTDFVPYANTGPLTVGGGSSIGLSTTGEAWRYARGSISTGIVGGGTVTCFLMAVE